jgi:probable HAF family extracellular repeat protein
MNIKIGLRVFALGVLAVQALSLSSTASAQRYTITDLGSSTWYYSMAHGMNNIGEVVGEFEPNSYVRGFWYSHGTMFDVGHLSGTPYTVAYGVNDTSQVVGESSATYNTHACLFMDGKMSDLGTLADSSGYSSAHAINQSGDIVGESSLVDPSVIHAALYPRAGSPTDLGALGGDYSSASSINKSGVIVGESDAVSDGVTNVHAFVYSNGSMQDLGTLGGGYSSAKGINDSGVIVGEAESLIEGATYLRAFVYRNGTMSALGTFGGSSSSASAINSAGQIVGYATDVNEVSDAFLFDGTQMLNLFNLIPSGSGWTNLGSADAINDAGQIAGSGYRADGSYHAYLLTPVAPLSVVITAPAANSTFQGPATFPISAVTTDKGGTVTNVQFLANNTVIGNSTSSPFGATASNLGPGICTLTAVASDNVGRTASNSISVMVVDTPPTVAITNPLANATFQAPATFTIGAAASDPDGTITNLQFLVDSTVIGNSASAPFALTASNLGIGVHTLTAVASDNGGLTATSSISVTVLDTPPTIAITNPLANATFQAPATFAIGAAASDVDGIITNVQFLVDGVVIGNSTSSPFAATAGHLGVGTHTLTAVASDDGGLTTTSSISVTVLDTPPTIAITNPLANATFQAPATFAIGAAASDVDGLITNVQFLVDSAVIGNSTSSPFAATASNLAAGIHTLTAVASDNGGLTATSSISVTVVDTPPTITITNPLANATFQAPATFAIAAAASDVDGTVTNVQFLVNSTVIGSCTSLPHAATASNLGPGIYTLTAVASDNGGLTATNSISVTVLDTPPTIAITNPIPNANFQAPATFSIGAVASDPDGTVTNVQFSVNGNVIGISTSFPFAATATNLGAGTYSLTAVALDDAGLKATNSITIAVTNRVATVVTLLNPSLTKTGFVFSFATQTGFTYNAQYATRLAPSNYWTPFSLVFGSDSLVWVTNSSVTDSQRYYRVVAH